MHLHEAVLDYLDAAGWACLVCTSRQLKQQVLAAIYNKQHTVSIVLNPRTRHNALQHLAFVGTYCPHVTHITVHDETPHRGLQSLQLLLPCMTAQLQSLMLHGVHLASRGFQASDLVQHLLQHCPHLRELGLQGCKLLRLSCLYDLFSSQQAAPTELGSMQQLKLEVLQLDSINISDSIDSSSSSKCSQHADANKGTAGALQELHLACGNGSWLYHCLATHEQTVLELMRVANCQALRVLDVSKHGWSLSDSFMEQLVQQQATWVLQELDISLTVVTPDGLLTLAKRCPQLSVLRYICREGNPSLQQQHLLQLAAACPQLQQLDLSLHTLLDDACMAVLATCTQLKALTLSRSHKVTAAGLQQLLEAGRMQQLTLIRCKGVGRAQLQQLRRQFPAVSFEEDRPGDAAAGRRG